MAFQQLRQGVKTNAAPAEGTVLESAAFRLTTALKSSALFGNVEVATTEDEDRLLIAMVSYLPGTDEQQVQDYLSGLWFSQVRYRGWDAHSFLVASEHVEMQAATLHASGNHYVTVHIVATANAFAKEELPVASHPKATRRSLLSRRNKAVSA